MIPILPYPIEASDIPLTGSHGWTRPEEVRALIYLARQTAGTIVEIGCNEGETTLELARAFSSRAVIGVDWTGPDPTMCAQQTSEGRPTPESIGRKVRGMHNVRIVDKRSADLDYAAIMAEIVVDPIGFIFIDGDHSYEGVGADTKLALGYLLRQKVHNSRWRCTIAWHDVSETHPNWVGVLPYLLNQVAPFYPVQRIADTWLAYVVLEPGLEKFAGELYETYCSAVGGKAWNGDVLPNWIDFRADAAKRKQVDAWIVVARNVKSLL